MYKLGKAYIVGVSLTPIKEECLAMLNWWLVRSYEGNSESWMKYVIQYHTRPPVLFMLVGIKLTNNSSCPAVLHAERATG